MGGKGPLTPGARMMGSCGMALCPQMEYVYPTIGPLASGLPFPRAGFCLPVPARIRTLHALLVSVSLSTQHVAVLVPFLCSLLGPSGLNRGRSPSWSPFSCLMPPKYCGHPGLPVSTSLYRLSPLLVDGHNSSLGISALSHPGHNYPRRIRLSSEDAPV